MSQRTYSEKEVAEIIKRAAELETGKSAREHDNRPGLSLEELSAIAVEAGLDPENVREAARQLSSPAKKSHSTIARDDVVAERWVTGELTDELADLVIADLNHRYNATHIKKSWKDNILEDGDDESVERSKVQRTGNSIEWKYPDEGKKEVVRALIQPKKNQIRIRVSKRYNRDASYTDLDSGIMGYLSYIPFLAALVVLISLPYSFFLNAILAILMFTILQLGLLPAARKITEKRAGRKEKGDLEIKSKKSDTFAMEVNNVADDLARLLSSSSAREQNSHRIEIEEDVDKIEQDNREKNKKNRSGH
ncbi:hypothetical protein BH23BAC3_BH23BAC3_08370 [soil metagenome]